MFERLLLTQQHLYLYLEKYSRNWKIFIWCILRYQILRSHTNSFSRKLFRAFSSRPPRRREDREVRSTTLVLVSYIAHIASKDRCKPVARPVPSTARIQRPSRSSRSHIRCAQLISGRISDLSLLPGVHRCVWVSVIPVGTERRRVCACTRWYGGIRAYWYRLPYTTGHQSRPCITLTSRASRADLY